MTQGLQSDAWTQREEGRVKACAKALLLDQPLLRPTLGRFVLRRLIGKGAHGAVYEATDAETDEIVALKTLRSPDATGIHDFKSEFRALAGIAHENLVQLHELFVECDEWYFTMELVPGSDFAVYVRARSGAGSDFVSLRHAFCGLGTGVQAIHSAGKLHCDLKPSNVRVTESGRVVVLDYGLVSAGAAAGEHSASLEARHGSRLRGTPEYMAPELTAGSVPTRASDVYAMGVMLFVALTGRLPFPGRTPAAVTAKRFANAPRAQSIAGHVPEDLDSLCAVMLARDPSERPALDQVLSELGVQSSASAHIVRVDSASMPFVGRVAELELLHAALNAVEAQRPVAVFVRGSSGIGKSALLDRFAEQLGDSAVVLMGRCYEREALPYKGFDGIIDALARYLGTRPTPEVAAVIPHDLAALLQVFPALKRVPGFDAVAIETSPLIDQQELRQQAFDALKALLRALSEQRALVLIADDLQWADLDSARLLLELLAPPAAPALLYVGGNRSEDEAHSEFLKELLASPVAAHNQSQQRALHLAPLDAATCSVLALQLLRGRVPDPEQVAARIGLEASGVPFFVRELAHYVATQAKDQTIALSLAELLESRVAALQPAARQALVLLALAGRPVPEQVLAQALVAHERWQHALRVLEAAGLTRSDANGALVIYHDRVRESIAERLSSDERTRMNEALARAYEGANSGEPEWLIEHWRAAGNSARALEYAIIAAASAAQKLAFNRAATLYRTALELVEPHDPRKTGLYAQLGEACGNAGRGEDAAAAFLAASEKADAETSLTLRCRALQQQLRSSNRLEETALLEQLLVEVGISFPRNSVELFLGLFWSRVRIAFFKWPAIARLGKSDHARRRRIEVLRAVFREYSVSDPLRGLLFQNEFYAQALAARDEEAVFVGLAWESYNYSFRAGPRGRRGNANRLARLQTMAAKLDSPYAHGTVSLMRAAAALYEGRYVDVEPPAAIAQETFSKQCTGAVWEGSFCAAVRYNSIEIAGPIRTLCQDVPVLSRRAIEHGDLTSDVSITIGMALALLADDEPESAREYIEARRGRLASRLSLTPFLYSSRLVDCLRYAGDNLAAWQHWEEIWRAYSRSPFDRLGITRMIIHAQRARCAVNMSAERWDDSLARIAELEAGIVLRINRPESRALSASALAALAFQQGDLDRARTQLTDAIAAADTAGIHAYRLCYEWQLGRISGGSEGADLLERADRTLREQGVVNPARWTAVYAPGFDKPPPA